MSIVGSLNLIEAFNYYLTLVFVVGTTLRARNYRVAVGLVYQSSDRWPKLRALAKTHNAIFLRWPTVLPVAVTLALSLGNALASYLVWSHARVTLGGLWSHPPGLAAAITAGGLMGFLDFRSVFLFGRFDRPKVEAVLDRAE
ncbi:MAG TPA: hypothetical protein VH092_35110 [Urbifossiella sp.]|nr:hypothetical protein [Urbifossiella sp.]